MQTFLGLLIIIPVCAMLASLCLMLAKQPINFASITIFTLTGGIIGCCVMVLWGLVFANKDGTIESGYSVLSMFLVSGTLAVGCGFYFVSLYNKRL